MTPTLTTTPDGEIVYDPPHEHHLVERNGEPAWCCSTRGTPAGRIAPVTRIPSGSGVVLRKRTRARQAALRRKHSQSMNGPSGKTAANAASETTPNTPNEFPPTHATADLVASGAKIVSAREVSTVNGLTCVLTSEDGTDYWGSALLLSQLDKNPDLLPDIVVEVTSANGRVYRTFSKAQSKPARTFGRTGVV